MRHKIEFARRALRFIYELLFTYLLVLFGEIVWIKEFPPLRVIIAIAVMYVVSYIVREKIPTYVGILICHIGLICVPFVVDFSGGQRFIFVCIGVHLLTTSMEYALRGSKLKALDDIPWPTFVISVIIYIFGWATKEPLLYNAALIIPIVLLFLHYIMVYVEGVRSYVEATKDVSGLPLSHILSVNTSIVGFILLVLLVSIVLGESVDFGKVLNVIGDLLVSIFKIFAVGVSFIMRFISKLMSSGSDSDKLDSNLQSGGFISHSGYAYETGENILKVLVGILIIYIVYRILKAIAKRLIIARSFEGDIVEEAEKVISSQEEKIRRRLFGRLSGEEKIRRYYKERVLKDKYDISLRGDTTCRDIEKDIAENTMGDVSELTDIYASVRYGETTPDKSLVKRVSSLSKQ